MTDGPGALYVYGVVGADEVPDLDVPGVGEEHRSPRAVTHDGIAALVSDVETAPLSAARDLRAHWRVLDAVAKRTTVLPVRFGTVVESEDVLRNEFLAPEATRLGGLLERLAGKVQLTVKGFYDEEPLLREVIAGSPAIGRLRERLEGLPQEAAYYDRIRLGEMVAAEVERRREGDTALVLERLEPLAVAAKAEEGGSADTAVNAAFLVERSRVDEFSEAVGRLGDELADRMRMRYVGPLPPYSFAETDVTAGGAAWA